MKKALDKNGIRTFGNHRAFSDETFINHKIQYSVIVYKQNNNLKKIYQNLFNHKNELKIKSSYICIELFYVSAFLENIRIEPICSLVCTTK